MVYIILIYCETNYVYIMLRYCVYILSKVMSSSRRHSLTSEIQKNLDKNDLVS